MFSRRTLRLETARRTVSVEFRPASSDWQWFRVRAVLKQHSLGASALRGLRQLSAAGKLPRDLHWVETQLLRLAEFERLHALPPFCMRQQLALRAVLLLHAHELQDRLEGLVGIFNQPYERVLAKVRRFPGLLSLSTARLRVNLAAVEELLGFSEERAQRVAYACPTLLLTATDVLRGRLGRLRSLVEGCKEWTEELHDVAAPQVARVLCAKHAELDRLEYFRTLRWQPTQWPKLLRVVSYAEEDFDTLFPRYFMFKRQRARAYAKALHQSSKFVPPG